jgi:hypothetical protein
MSPVDIEPGTFCTLSIKNCPSIFELWCVKWPHPPVTHWCTLHLNINSSSVQCISHLTVSEVTQIGRILWILRDREVDELSDSQEELCFMKIFICGQTKNNKHITTDNSSIFPLIGFTIPSSRERVRRTLFSLVFHLCVCGIIQWNLPCKGTARNQHLFPLKKVSFEYRYL